MGNLYGPLLQQFLCGYWEWDILENNFYLSTEFKKMLGYTDNELFYPYKKFETLLFANDAKIFMQKLQQYAIENAKLPFVATARFLNKNGIITEMLATIWPIERDNENKLTKMAGCNITNLNYENHQNNTEKIIKTSPIGLIGGWEIDLANDNINWTEEVRQIYGVEKDYKPSMQKWVALHEDFAHGNIMKDVFNKLISTGVSCNQHLDIVTKTGLHLSIHMQGFSVFENGSCVRLFGTLQDVTSQKNQREHLDVIFEESTNAHLLIDESGIIDCNNAAVKMLGLSSKAELLSTHPSVFSPEFQPDGSRSKEKSLEMDKIAYERGINCFEWVHKKKDGEEVLVEVTLNSVKVDGKPVLLVIWYDITERKRAEQQLIKSEALLNETQELTHSGSWEYDLQTGENNWSAESFRIFELAHSNLGLDTHLFADMIHPNDRDIYDDAITNAIRYKASCDIELRIMLNNGTVKWIRAIGKPYINAKGIVTKLHGAISDITEEKAASEALKKAKEQAEQAAIAKSQFLTTMSHEIRTPMNAVIGFTHLLMRNAREDQMEFLKVLKFSGENLLVLINDILDFSKIEAGKIEFEEVDFELKELMGNIKSAMLHRAKSKGLKLKLLIDDDLPDFLMGDQVRLGQILTNLVSNAIKFTETGSIFISALLSSQDNEFTTVYFEVKDSGIGIAEDKQESIFESFTQASSNTTRVYGGTGLGLTITKRLLEMMKSTISVKSRLGEGAVFHFELRLRNSQQKLAAQENIAVLEKTDLKGMKLLVADDNRINILLAKELLRQWEVNCDIAENGLQALELVKKNDYDMVLMDLQMPEMDGYQATQEIRKLEGEKYQKLPIIALTASAMIDIKEKALALGMSGYLSKPFNPDEFYKKIQKHTTKKLAT